MVKSTRRALAQACGFARETFQQIEWFAATLDAAVQEPGIDVRSQPNQRREEPGGQGDHAETLGHVRTLSR
jgi:hypothetical protein